MRYDTSRTRRVRARATHGEDYAGTDGSPVPVIPVMDADPAFNVRSAPRPSRGDAAMATE